MACLPRPPSALSNTLAEKPALDGLDWRRLFAEDGVGKGVSLERVGGVGIAVNALVALSRHPTPLASLNDAARPSAGSHITHNLGVAFLKTSLAEPFPRLCPNNIEHFVVCETKKSGLGENGEGQEETFRMTGCLQRKIVVPRLLWVTSRRFVKPMVLCH